MANAKLDENSRPTLTALSNAGDGSIVDLYADPTTHRLLIDTAGSSNLVVGTSTITGGTTGQLLYDNGGVVGELTTATYPSLTELSYVKGVTSAIQTQINGKQASGTYLKGDGSVTGATGQTQIFTDTLQITALTASQAIVTDASKNLISKAYTNLNTGSTIVSRDSNGNANFVNAISTAISTVGSGQSINMTAGSAWQQIVTGSGNITFNLPDATTLFLGETFAFNNNGTGIITVNLNDGSTLVNTVPAGGYMTAFCTNNSTTNGIFDDHESLGDGAISGSALTNFNHPILATTVTSNQSINTINAVTVTSNAGTVPITYRNNTFTNSSASTMAITMAVTSAVDGQLSLVRIYDASGVAQTIGWTNTENSTVPVPLTSNGSTTLPLTVGLQFNGATSKWRCIAVA